MELTILMPCLNEAETLATCVRKARASLTDNAIDGEVMVADNGSTDGSREIARREGAVVIDVAARGYGAALLGGIKASRARFVIMGDADDSYDFSHLMPYVEKLRAGADVVVGNRFKGGIAKGAMPVLHRYLGNPVLSFLGRLFFHLRVGDFHCGLRGFDRERVLELGLVTPGMEFASEMIVKAALRGRRIEEVPTTLKPDGRTGSPHLRTWRDGWRHLRFLLIFSPRYLYLTPGLLMFVIGLAGVIALYGGPRPLTASVTLGIHSFVGLVLLTVLGAQVLLFGVIAQAFADALGIHRGKHPWWARVASLENMLLVALVLFLGGVAGAAWCFSRWADTGYQALAYGQFLRPFVVSLAAILIAAQMGFTSFFATTFGTYFQHARRAAEPRNS